MESTAEKTLGLSNRFGLRKRHANLFVAPCRMNEGSVAIQKVALSALGKRRMKTVDKNIDERNKQ